jgi:hypothetical protein
MPTFRELLTDPPVLVLCDDPHGVGPAWFTLLVDDQELNDECVEAVEKVAGGILEHDELQLIGFYNVPEEEFDPAGEAPPEFDALLFFRESEGGEEGPVYLLELEGKNRHFEVFAPSFADAGFRQIDA